MGHGDKVDCRLNNLCAAPKGAHRGRQGVTESRAFSLPLSFPMGTWVTLPANLTPTLAGISL